MKISKIHGPFQTYTEAVAKAKELGLKPKKGKNVIQRSEHEFIVEISQEAAVTEALIEALVPESTVAVQSDEPVTVTPAVVTPSTNRVPTAELISLRANSTRRTAAGKFNKQNMTVIGGRECPKFFPMTWAQRDAFMETVEGAPVKERYLAHLATVAANAHAVPPAAGPIAAAVDQAVEVA